jgi:chromosome segregation ATPase
MAVFCVAILAPRESRCQTLTIPPATSDARPGSAINTASLTEPINRALAAKRATDKDALDLEALKTRIQEGQQPNLDELKKLALILAENKRLKEENAGLKDERDAKQGQIDSLSALVATWKNIAGEWKDAASNRKEATGDATGLYTACQGQLSKADAEIARQEVQIERLKHPGLLQELFQPKELIKIGGAFALGRATATKN